MTDTAFKQKLDETLAPYIQRAKANGRALKDEIDALGTQGRPYSSEERVAVSAYFDRRRFAFELSRSRAAS